MDRTAPTATTKGPLENIEIDDDAPPEILEYARKHGYRPAHPRVLPPERFINVRATQEQCEMGNAPTGPDDTGPKSKTIRMRLAGSCAGWKQPPTSEEFYEAVRAETPDERERAILDTGRSEAEDLKVLDAWTEHAYTFRTLAAGAQTGRHRTGRDRRNTEPPQHVIGADQRSRIHPSSTPSARHKIDAMGTPRPST